MKKTDQFHMIKNVCYKRYHLPASSADRQLASDNLPVYPSFIFYYPTKARFIPVYNLFKACFITPSTVDSGCSCNIFVTTFSVSRFANPSMTNADNASF